MNFIIKNNNENHIFYPSNHQFVVQVNSYNLSDSFCNPDSRLSFVLILLLPKR
jgi:hypothetical protein